MDINNSKIAGDKLALLYIIYRSDNLMTYEQLANIVLEYDFFNYFDYVSYLKELIDSDFIDLSKKPYVCLTDFSLKSLKLLKEELEDDLIHKIDQIFKPVEKKESLNYSTINLLPNSKFLITLTVDDKMDKNFSINFTLDGIDEANEVSMFWENYHTELYYLLRDLLSGKD